MIKVIRGATTVEKNSKEDISRCSVELINEIINANGLVNNQIIDMIFTATYDLTAYYPSKAVRENGYNDIPMLNVKEMTTKDMLKKCIRVLLHVETDKKVIHKYLRNAINLRSDLNND